MYKTIFVIAFSVILSAPFVNMVFDIVPDLELNEKRALKPKPEFNVSELYAYLDEYTAYFQDHFGFRNYLVSANLFLKLKYFKKSPIPAKVILGKNDWLFLGRSDDLLINRKRRLSDRECMKFIENSLVEKTRQFAAHGIKYYVMLVPEKSYTYPEYLPEEYYLFDPRKHWDEMVNYLMQNKELNIVNINSSLLEAKKQSEDIIFQSNDTHWNNIGALSAYSTFLHQLKKDFHNDFSTLKTPYVWKKAAYDAGDLDDLLSLPHNLKDHQYQFTPRDTADYIYDKALDHEQFDYTFVNPNRKNNPSILMLHDSFGVFFKPWLINDFHEVRAVFTTLYNFSVDDFASSTNSKIVLHEMVPRNTVLPMLYK